MPMNVERARTILTSEGVDAVITSSVENTYYVSGLWVRGQVTQRYETEFYTLATADTPDRGTIICSIGHADFAAGAAGRFDDLVTFGTFFRDSADAASLNETERRVLAITQAHVSGRTSLDALCDAITAKDLSRSVVAVDERGPRSSTLLTLLAERFPEAEFRPAAALMRTVRAVKTAAEQQLVIDALRVNELGFRAALDRIVTGVTERELKAEFDVAVTRAGGQPGFCLVKFSRGMALGQVPPGDNQLVPGDFLFFDIGVDKAGYKSDIGRLVSFGAPGPDLVALFDACRAGQQAAIDAMRPGVTAHQIFDIGVAAVRDAGISTYQRQHVGHAIGIEYYDHPVLSPLNDVPLEEGATFEVETPYYRLGVGGAFIEDTVLLRAHGADILTELDRELIVVEPK
jgi:Xaa-Pro dipeptidase